MRQRTCPPGTPFKTSFEPPPHCGFGQSSSRMWLTQHSVQTSTKTTHCAVWQCTCFHACLSGHCGGQTQVDSPSFTNYDTLGTFFYLLKTVTYLQNGAIHSFPASSINMRNWNCGNACQMSSTASGTQGTPIKCYVSSFPFPQSMVKVKKTKSLALNWSTIGKRQ